MRFDRLEAPNDEHAARSAKRAKARLERVDWLMVFIWLRFNEKTA